MIIYTNSQNNFYQSCFSSFQTKMSHSRSSSYHNSIERMQKSIQRLDHELRRSRQLLAHDITIDNRTRQDLNFIIKVEEEDQMNHLNKSQSRVVIPHQSSYRHRVSTTPRERERVEYPWSDNRPKQRYQIFGNKTVQTTPYDEYSTPQRYKYQPMTPREGSSSIKVQRKFQPFSRIQGQKHPQEHIKVQYQSNENRYATPHGGFIDQFIIQDRKMPQSKIQQQGRINFTYNPPEQHYEQKQFQKTQTVNLPVLLSEHNTKHLQNQPYISQSPQVLNYLKQQITHHHPQVYTPMPQQQTAHENTFDVSLSSIGHNRQSIDRKEQQQWQVEPLTVGYQNNKKYFQQVKEKEMLNKVREREERKKRWNYSYHSGSYQSPAKKQDKEFEYIAKFQLPSGKKQKANDLFLERKSLFLKNLQKSKQKQKKEKKTHHKHHDRSRSKNHSISSQNLSTLKKKRDTSSSKEMSSRVKDISQRLYSRSKEKLHPCDHYQRHAQSIQRQRFYSIIHQNSFVQKYVSKDEQEDLFQQFRRDEQSVSSWPMKILNYTYSKLQKINSSRYTVRKVYQ